MCKYVADFLTNLILQGRVLCEPMINCCFIEEHRVMWLLSVWIYCMLFYWRTPCYVIIVCLDILYVVLLKNTVLCDYCLYRYIVCCFIEEHRVMWLLSVWIYCMLFYWRTPCYVIIVCMDILYVVLLKNTVLCDYCLFRYIICCFIEEHRVMWLLSV